MNKNEILSKKIKIGNIRRTVLIKNDFFEINISELNNKEQNFLRFLFSQAKNNFNHSIKISDIKKEMKISGISNSELIEYLEETKSKLASTILDANTKNISSITFPIFKYIEIDKNNDLLKYEINEVFIKWFKDLKKLFSVDLKTGYTKYYLESFTKLKSKYSQILFEYLMQFQNGTKSVTIKVDDFKNRLGNNDLDNSYLKRNIIDKAIPELAKIFKNLIWEFFYSTNSSRGGKKINAVYFKWDDLFEEHKPKKYSEEELSLIERKIGLNFDDDMLDIETLVRDIES